MRAVIVLMLLATVALADEQQDRAEAQRIFYIGVKAFKAQRFGAAVEQFEEAYKVIPLPEIAFSCAQAHRKQFRIDRDIRHAQRAVELYKAYLAVIKEGAQTEIAVDGLEAMERELFKAGTTTTKVAPAAVVERTTIIVNPELGTESSANGYATFEIANIAETETAKVVVLVDGKPAAAYEKLDVEPGMHKIHVEVEGYVPIDANERAVKGANVTSNLQLEPKPAKVTIKTESGARIRIDGRAQGNGPVAELAIPAGRHVIGITHKGRESIAREITVRRGEVITLDEPMSKTTRRKVVPWVVAGAGVFAVFSITSTIGAFVFDSRASDKLSGFENEGDKSPSDVADYNRYVDRRDQLTTGALITGGAALLIGSAALVLYAFDSPGDAELRVTPAATPGGGGLVVGGTF